MQVGLSFKRIAASRSLDHMVNANGTSMSEDCCKSISRPSGECKWNFHVKRIAAISIISPYDECKWNFHVRGLLQFYLLTIC